jgi:F-box-like
LFWNLRSRAAAGHEFDLPFEIFLQIASYLVVWPDLLRMRRVSRSWHALVTRALPLLPVHGFDLVARSCGTREPPCSIDKMLDMLE